MLKSFSRDSQGGVTVVFALLSLVFICVGGIAIDTARVFSSKTKLQAAVDSAVLAAAHGATSKEQLSTFNAYFGANVQDTLDTRKMTSSLSITDSELTGEASLSVEMTLSKVFHPEPIEVGAKATVMLSSRTPTEISIVLDVSSSMIEEDRFEPMRAAALEFLDLLAASANPNLRVSIVPFSSRINVGMPNKAFFSSFDGNAAIPDRWVNPGSYYGSSYATLTWVDGQTVAKDNGKNYYWMGCVEPRLDVAVQTGGDKVLAVSDASPAQSKFVAMDHNAQSGKSFCPPPVVPLTTDFAKLASAVKGLTSQGSTRLDTGMLGAWYTLSPKWSGAWASGDNPSTYGSGRKIVVFMTDGQMNTQSNAAGKHYDWVCAAASDCDAYANSVLLAACEDMKDAGIEIFTISYDEDAEQTHLKACASDQTHYFAATSKTSGSDSIASIYNAIAERIRTVGIYLAR